MAKWKEGDRVRVVARAVTEDDRKKNQYFEHMAGLVGNVQNVYSDDEISVRVDPEFLGPVSSEVRRVATQRMREKFLSSVSEEQKRSLSKDELEFDVNYVLLLRSRDLEAA